MNNNLLFRLFLLLKHSIRIAFLPWPKYTFNDLATAQDAIDGPRFEAMSTRFKRSKSGQRLLKERPLLSFDAMDWKYLSELPIHTFGYCVWHHFVSNDIFEEPDLGVQRIKWNNEGEYIKTRFRQTHDFRHVLLGLGVSGKEEVMVNIFQARQFPLILSSIIALGGSLKHGWASPIQMLKDAKMSIKSAERSHFLPELYFESLWEEDLNSLRKELNLKPIGNLYPPTKRLNTAVKVPV